MEKVIISKVIARTQRHTHTHTAPIALPGLLKWPAMELFDSDRTTMRRTNTATV